FIAPERNGFAGGVVVGSARPRRLEVEALLRYGRREVREGDEDLTVQPLSQLREVLQVRLPVLQSLGKGLTGLHGEQWKADALRGARLQRKLRQLQHLVHDIQFACGLVRELPARRALVLQSAQIVL